MAAVRWQACPGKRIGRGGGDLTDDVLVVPQVVWKAVEGDEGLMEGRLGLGLAVPPSGGGNRRSDSGSVGGIFHRN